MNQSEFADAVRRATEGSNPFRDFTRGQSASTANTYQVPQTVRREPRNKLQAALGGFIGTISAAGYQLELQRVTSRMTYFRWREPNGTVHPMQSNNNASLQTNFITACAMLARKVEQLKHWRQAFADAGVKL